jgi:deoxyribonuclease (pyrimidine dimer)
MTRINCVPVEELRDKHLIAEYRELPRVFKLASAAVERNDDPNKYPQEYTLGTGHVKFFYTRLLWLSQRFQEIRTEMLKRGWKPQFSETPVFPNIPQTWYQSWTPTEQAIEINRQRIKERSPGV